MRRADAFDVSEKAWREGGAQAHGAAMFLGERLVVVMYGLETAAARAEKASWLIGWGFHAFDRRIMFEAGQTVCAASAYGGQSGEVPLVSARPRGENGKLVERIVYTGPLTAPVERGRDVGRLRIWRDDMLAVHAPLRTGASVAPGGLARRAFDATLEPAGGALRAALARFRR